MIIVAGHLRVDADDREDYVATCRDVVAAARAAGGCLDFAITADPLDADRVNIFERWESPEALERFRGDGPDVALGERIRAADVREYEVGERPA